MATKAKTKVVERAYTIPLRAEWVKQGRVHRARRSIAVVRSYLERHTKAEEIRLSAGVSEFIWMHGAKRPPASVRVAVTLDGGAAFARLPEEPLPAKAEGKKGNKAAPSKAPAAEEGKKAEAPPSPPAQTRSPADTASIRHTRDGMI